MIQRDNAAMFVRFLASLSAVFPACRLDSARTKMVRDEPTSTFPLTTYSSDDVAECTVSLRGTGWERRDVRVSVSE